MSWCERHCFMKEYNVTTRVLDLRPYSQAIYHCLQAPQLSLARHPFLYVTLLLARGKLVESAKVCACCLWDLILHAVWGVTPHRFRPNHVRSSKSINWWWCHVISLWVLYGACALEAISMYVGCILCLAVTQKLLNQGQTYFLYQTTLTTTFALGPDLGLLFEKVQNKWMFCGVHNVLPAGKLRHLDCVAVLLMW